jgi:tripartite-type tricarboxylate transporter receptor subunit TctC
MTVASPPDATVARTTLAILTTAVAVLASPAMAQDEYPTQPVRLIAPSGPGGNPDVLARLLAERFTTGLGKPFIVENMPGAGGIVAANMVAKAAPDGHVLMFGDSGNMAINPALNPSLGYDPIKDFAPVTALVSLPTILVAKPSVPAVTLDEFIALARQQPGKMSFGSAGAGSIHHLTMAMFADAAGIELLHVPYRGGSAMVNGLLTGEIEVGWSGIPNVMTLIESGQLRGYCISVLTRSPSTPAIPTCDELGRKGFDIATVMGMQAPAGTSPKILVRLQAQAAAVMREPALAARMKQLGMVMEEKGTANYVQFMKYDMERYAEAVKKLNLQ